MVEYWIIDLPARQIEVYALSRGNLGLQQTARAGDVVRSLVPPDFSVEVELLFGD